MDHELTHLELAEKEGAPVLDDGGRPKLKMRLHDYEFGWFTEVAERHKENAIEVQQARALIDGDGQVYFPFLADEMSRADVGGLKASITTLGRAMKESGFTASVSVGGGPYIPVGGG